MALTDYAAGGRRVALSDLIFAFTVSCPDEGILESFVRDNASRIGEVWDGAEDKWLDLSKPSDPTVVLTFSNPPGQSRSHFVLGRDPDSCDVVVSATPTVSRTHLKFGFDGEEIALYDVSSFGTELTLGEGEEPKQTRPTPGTPFKCVLPRGRKITLAIANIKFQFTLPRRQGPELDEYRWQRDAFLARGSRGGLSRGGISLRPYHQDEWKPLYTFQHKLGEGGFGTVYKVRRERDGAVFAAKQLRERDERQSDSLVNEMRALRRLEHEHVVEYVDWYEDSTPHRSVLVMEYCPCGSLEDMLIDLRRSSSPCVEASAFTHRRIAIILKQVAEGLAYLHSERITHRDLKPANILVRQRQPLSLVLGDFGLAKIHEKDQPSWMETTCGTESHSAPEMHSTAPYSRAVDIWALGVVGIQMLRVEEEVSMNLRGGGIREYYPKDVFKRAEAMSKSNRHPRPLLAMIRNMLASEPSDRPSAAVFVAEASNLIALNSWGLGVARNRGVLRSAGQLPAPEFQDRAVHSDALQHYLEEPVVEWSAARKRGADDLDDLSESEAGTTSRKMRRIDELEHYLQ